MAKKKHSPIILTGEELRRFLASYRYPVKWISSYAISGSVRGNGISPIVSAQMAYCMVSMGTYFGRVNLHGRLLYIREIPDARRSNAHDPAHWDGRAMLRWNKAVDKQTVDLWMQVFRAQAAAASGATS